MSNRVPLPLAAKRTLRPGRHTLVVTATPVAGGAARTSTAPFKIVR